MIIELDYRYSILLFLVQVFANAPATNIMSCNRVYRTVQCMHEHYIIYILRLLKSYWEDFIEDPQSKELLQWVPDQETVELPGIK